MKPQTGTDSVVRTLSLKVAGLALGAALVAPAQAIVVPIDSFTIMRDGIVLFHDGFGDGLPPSSAPDGQPAYLFTRGMGTESGGVLNLTPSLAPIGAGATGSLSQTARATVDTNVDPNNLVDGLKSSPMTFSATAVFGFVAPGTGESYSLRFIDRNASGGANAGSPFGNDVAQIAVRNVNGAIRVQMREPNFVDDAIYNGSYITLTPAMLAGVDQIALTLSRADPSSTLITGSFALLSGGAVSTWLPLAGGINIFGDENSTRAEFLASQAPIPEPASYVLMLGGLALVGFAVGRRKRT